MLIPRNRRIPVTREIKQGHVSWKTPFVHMCADCFVFKTEGLNTPSIRRLKDALSRIQKAHNVNEILSRLWNFTQQYIFHELEPVSLCKHWVWEAPLVLSVAVYHESSLLDSCFSFVVVKLPYRDYLCPCYLILYVTVSMLKVASLRNPKKFSRGCVEHLLRDIW